MERTQPVLLAAFSGRRDRNGRSPSMTMDREVTVVAELPDRADETAVGLVDDFGESILLPSRKAPGS